MINQDELYIITILVQSLLKKCQNICFTFALLKLSLSLKFNVIGNILFNLFLISSDNNIIQINDP